MSDLSLQELSAACRQTKVPLSLQKHHSAQHEMKEVSWGMWFSTRAVLGEAISDKAEDLLLEILPVARI